MSGGPAFSHWPGRGRTTLSPSIALLVGAPFGLARGRGEWATQRNKDLFASPLPRVHSIEHDDGNGARLRLQKGSGLGSAKLHNLIGASVLEQYDLSKKGEAKE